MSSHLTRVSTFRLRGSIIKKKKKIYIYIRRRLPNLVQAFELQLNSMKSACVLNKSCKFYKKCWNLNVPFNVLVLLFLVLLFWCFLIFFCLICHRFGIFKKTRQICGICFILTFFVFLLVPDEKGCHKRLFKTFFSAT